jgi:hypothetical protein
MQAGREASVCLIARPLGHLTQLVSSLFFLHNHQLQGLNYPNLPVLITAIGFSYQACYLR